MKIITSILSKLYYFFIPFLVWIIIGLIIQLKFSEKTIFYLFNGSFTNKFFDYTMILFSILGRAEFMAIVFIIYFLNKKNRTFPNFLIVALFSIFNPLVISILKNNFIALRPLQLFGETKVYHLPLIEKAFLYSFPSGHTMGVFGFFTVLLFLWNKNKKIGTLFFILSLCCGISRMYLGQHFFNDVLLGSIFGVMLSLLIIWVVENINFK